MHKTLPATFAAAALLLILGAATADETVESDNKLSEVAQENRLRLEFDGNTFSGPAFERLLAEARESQFFLIGEEHGIAENPKLAAQLFADLTDDGYEKLAIEVSPPIAALLDSVAKDDGLDGLAALFSSRGGEPAFFGMREEAELLVAARTALPNAAEVFWGLDYEVASDRPLLQRLHDMDRPASSDEPLDALIAASGASWSKYDESGSPKFIFSFAGDPGLVTAVADAWPNPSAEASWILDTLRETLAINQLWMQGRGWDSNARRANLFRSNFLKHWQAAGQNGDKPKVMVKLGGNHVVRGRNYTGTFDLGTLLPEIAAADDSRSFSILVLPGSGSMTAVLNPSTWTYSAQPGKDGYASGLEVLANAAYDDAFTLIDLAALRPVVGSSSKRYGAEVAQVVHGFDMLLIMSGSSAATDLAHD